MKYLGTISDPKDLVNKEYVDAIKYDIAEDYDSSETYNIGDLVLYDNILYKCIEIATGTWDSSKWTETTVDVQMQGYLPLDGYSEDATVGNAEQLVSTKFVNDQAPYNFRTAGGNADIGDREYDTVVGGTVVWNQLVKNGNFTSTDNWSARDATESVSNNVLTAVMTAENTPVVWQTGFSHMISGRIIFVCAEIKYGAESAGALIRFWNSTKNGAKNLWSGSIEANVWNKIAFVRSVPAQIDYTDNIRFDIFPHTTSAEIGTEFQVKNVMFIDLTMLFGSTVADYIYSLEQNNAGDGVAYVTKLFPKLNGGYYAYNAGQFMSVNTSAHKMVGFNAFNFTTGQAKLLGGMNYQITGTYTTISYTDINGNSEVITPDADGCFIPTNNGTLTVTDGDSTTTCVHLVWDGEMDGEWDEYKEYNYPLDSSLTLIGVPMLDANDNLYYDGDTYESDGTVTRTHRICAGTELTSNIITAITTTEDGYTTFWLAKSATASTKKTRGMMICNQLPYGGNTVQNIKDFNGSCFGCCSATTYPSSWVVKLPTANVGTTSETIASYLSTSGIQFIYKLDAPSTESATPYQSPQIVDDFGTEEYVDYAYAQGTRDVAIPVGHNTNYAPNLRAKLEMLPNSPDGEGDYIMRQTNGGNAFAPLIIPSELPTMPSTDGTYNLVATVSDGETTLSWVSAI